MLEIDRHPYQWPEINKLQKNDDCRLITLTAANAVFATKMHQLCRAYKQCSLHCTGCPDGFTYVSSVNGCYKVVNYNKDWSAAGQGCRSLHKDAHLLVINNADEQLAIAGFLKPFEGQCPFQS